jgi:hypothetical protein
MYIQIVNFNLLNMTPLEFEKLCDGFAPQFVNLPGLLSKVWLADPATNTFGGVYAPPTRPTPGVSCSRRWLRTPTWPISPRAGSTCWKNRLDKLAVSLLTPLPPDAGCPAFPSVSANSLP